MTQTAETPAAAPAKSAISLANLKHALKVVGMAIDRTATIPVLECVRIEQLADGLALEATNIEIYIRAVMQDYNGPQTPTVIPAEKLIAWTKLLTGEVVRISKAATRATVQCDRARAVLPLVPATHWPSSETYSIATKGVNFTQGSFARALKFALISVDSSASRYTLDGVQLNGDGMQLRIVATNGHCMTLYTVPSTEKIDLLLPTRIIKALLPLLDDEDGGVDIAFTEKVILASIDADMRFYVGGTRISGQFPNWQAVYPKDPRTNVTVNAARFLESLERTMLLSDERSNCLRFTFGEQITIEGSSEQNGEAHESVDYVGKLDSPFRIALNGEYLISLAKKLSGDITIAVPADAQKPLLFKATPHEGETVEHIVMPMRG